MSKPLRALIIEDSESDAILLTRALRQGGYDPLTERVDTAEALRAALHKQEWDIVFSDYSMPSFSTPEALKILKQSGIDLPFILVTGTIGEDRAAAVMKAGAHDFFLKGDLVRLIPAVERELREAGERRKRRQMGELLRKLSGAVEQTADSVFITDLDGRIEYVNPAFEALTGYTQKEILGKTPALFKSGRHDRVFYERLWSTILSGQVLMALFINKKKNGELYYEEKTITPLKDTKGAITHFVSTGRDITERVKARDDLEKSFSLLRATLESTADGILVVDNQRRIVDYNKKFMSIWCIPESVITTGEDARAIAFVLDQLVDPQAFIEKVEELYNRPEADSYDILEFKDDRVFERYSQPQRMGDKIIGRVWSFRDITERRRFEQELTHLANHDALTGLPNRNLLNDRLGQTLIHARRSNRPVGILFIDLDRFKIINDTLGHAAGDELLKEASLRLQACVRPGDTVSRTGGDEFVVVLADLAGVRDVTAIAQKILEACSRSFFIKGQEFFLTSSIGISVHPDDGEDAQTLLKNADTAMYRAKEEGRNNYQFYTKKMYTKAVERLEMEINLRYALERGEFLLYYQPQVDLETGRITGVEALLRWKRSESELVPPARFIPLAEETGLIIPMGEWVLRTACLQGLAWQKAGLPPMSMAVNLSARQFKHEDLVGMV
ncbi:MAG: diguanylate cyclase, partial [Gammaproteobacteria bacterium]|nr:diguanylate cyclase [Gammaproteobacteria bacterium]